MPLKTGATKATQTQPMAWAAEPGKRGRKRSRKGWATRRRCESRGRGGGLASVCTSQTIPGCIGVFRADTRQPVFGFQRVRFEHIQ